MIGSNELKKFAANVPKIWSTFYDDGEAMMEIKAPNATFTVSKLPIWHPYFERVAGGFVHATLEMIMARPVPYKREIRENTDLPRAMGNR